MKEFVLRDVTKALSCQTLLVVRSSRGSNLSRLSCFLGNTSAVACACSLIVLCSLLSLSGVYYFCFLFSYLVKFLGTLTRVVKLDHSTLGLLQTTTRYRAVPQSY